MIKTGSAEASTQTDNDVLDAINSKEGSKVNSPRDERSNGLAPLNTVACFNKPESLLGQFEEDQVNELHMRLNALLNQIKKQSRLKEKQEKDLTDFSSSAWSTPTLLLIYLHNQIKAKAPIPVYSTNPSKADQMLASEVDHGLKIMPWSKMKTLLFDIYDHRVEFAPEISGAVNTSYLALEEHLICFFLDRHKDKSRDFIELSIIEFVAALKYYSEFWKRARIFAMMYGFLKVDDMYLGGRRSGTSDTRFPRKLNDGRVGELDVLHDDIYT